MIDAMEKSLKDLGVESVRSNFVEAGQVVAEEMYPGPYLLSPHT